jgi:hypothetical protein
MTLMGEPKSSYELEGYCERGPDIHCPAILIVIFTFEDLAIEIVDKFTTDYAWGQRLRIERDPVTGM